MWGPLVPTVAEQLLSCSKVSCHLIVAFYDWARRGPSPTASTGGSAAERRGCNKARGSPGPPIRCKMCAHKMI